MHQHQHHNSFTSISPTSTTSPPSTSSSSYFRPRKSDDWRDYRHVIEHLYRKDQLKLRDVKRHMEDNYNFVAS